MLPHHVAVKIDNPDDEHHDETVFIIRNHRDETTFDGTPIPKGWYEVVFPPLGRVGGFYTELVREDDIEVCGC
jgi:hypothetical protein